MNLKSEICSLFEVHQDANGVQRIITPLEYPGCGDRVVVRVRPDTAGFKIDENGEAAFLASLVGGDMESRAVQRWIEELQWNSPVSLCKDEVLVARAPDERLVAPYIFRVAEAAQQLHAIATARTERNSGDFKEKLLAAMEDVATKLQVGLQNDIELPIAGGLIADHVLDLRSPMIVIAATSPARLLEAEVIHMQYRMDNRPGFVLAVAESQTAVGKKQYERAAYYTDRTVVYNPVDLRRLVETQASQQLH